MTKDHDHRPKNTNGFMSSIRRALVRNAPSSIVEEMRPMILQPSGASKKAGGESRTKTRTGVDAQVLASAATGTFEFSVRDHSDATAKRGFRVHVPTRMLCYTILVFFVLPIALFLYFEMIKQSQKRQAARYHSFNQNKVLPHVFHQELLPPDDAGDSSILSTFTSTEGNETDVNTDQTRAEVPGASIGEPINASQQQDERTNNGGVPAEEMVEHDLSNEKNETEALFTATTSPETQKELKPTRIRRLLRAGLRYAFA